MNYVIERYDTTLRRALDTIQEKNLISRSRDSRQREEFKRFVGERDEAVSREEVLKEKCEKMMEELKPSKEAVERLEGEKANWNVRRRSLKGRELSRR